MLWKKDSNRPSAFYVNIFAKEGKKGSSDRLRFKPMPGKNDAISLQKRKEGNKLFGANDCLAAMEKYNESLCFAVRGSENIALVYANRSACFYHLGLFDECLADIELAKKAGYPDRLMPKLDKRHTECSERIERGYTRDEFGLKLSCEPDEKFPFMANVLKFQRDFEGECSAFAKKDIDAGQTIVVEKPFSAFLYKRFGWKCTICQKNNCNLIACENCTEAMFCSKECKEHFHHKRECNSKIVDDKGETSDMAMHDTRLLLQIIEMFPTADDLMEFVEQANKSDRNAAPDNLSDEKSKLREFIKLPVYLKPNRSANFYVDPYDVYALMQKMTKVKSMFTTEKHKRFLMHLATMIAYISKEHSNRYFFMVDKKDTLVNSNISLIRNYFQHSCAPNVHWLEINGCTVYITVRPIKKGEQLGFNAIRALLLSKEERHMQLGYTCKCTRCRGISATPKEREQLAANPAYSDLLILISRQIWDDKVLASFTDCCAMFMNEYVGHMKWCDEIGKVVSAYTNLLMFRFSGVRLNNGQKRIDLSLMIH